MLKRDAPGELVRNPPGDYVGAYEYEYANYEGGCGASVSTRTTHYKLAVDDDGCSIKFTAWIGNIPATMIKDAPGELVATGEASIFAVRFSDAVFAEKKVVATVIDGVPTEIKAGYYDEDKDWVGSATTALRPETNDK